MKTKNPTHSTESINFIIRLCIPPAGTENERIPLFIGGSFLYAIAFGLATIGTSLSEKKVLWGITLMAPFFLWAGLLLIGTLIEHMKKRPYQKKEISK